MKKVTVIFLLVFILISFVGCVDKDRSQNLCNNCKVAETTDSNYCYNCGKQTNGVFESEESKENIVSTADESETVYITLYGKKYHYSKSCAGGATVKTTEDSVKPLYRPCQKCCN